MTDKINLYINSSYRKKGETTTNLKVIAPSGLIKIYGKDYFTLSITSFYCFNTLYQMDEYMKINTVLRNQLTRAEARLPQVPRNSSSARGGYDGT
jgi:hypothetical protein